MQDEMQIYRQSAGHKVKHSVLPQTINPVGILLLGCLCGLSLSSS